MNVLITGASKGIGFELAKEFSSEERINLYLISRSIERLNLLKEECYNINKSIAIKIIPFDLVKLGEGERIEFDPGIHIDILINNAGALVNKKFKELLISDIDQMLMTNFKSPALLIQSLLTQMGGSKTTHVVNIGSMGGYQGSSKFPGLSVYSASKAALMSLTECLATELADDNIKFNCLALGAVQTEMLENAFPGYKAPIEAADMAKYIKQFALEGHKYYNGKVLAVSGTTP